MVKRGKSIWLPKQTLDEMEKIMITEEVSAKPEALRKMASYSQIGREVKRNITLNRQVNYMKKNKKKKELINDLDDWIGGLFR